jgi:hypothetical protein
VNSNFMNAKLVKTALGRTEMRTRAQGLQVLERRLLILADGTRTLEQLQEMFNVPILEFAAKLQTMGLLEVAGQSLASVMPVTPVSQAALTATSMAPTKPAPLAYDAYEIGVDMDVDAEAASAEDLASDFAEERNSTWTNSAWQDASNSQFPDETVPGMLTHRAASAAGLAAGKSYLIGTSETMLGADATVLVRKILTASTEADLYFALEMLVNAVSPKASSSEVNGIIQRFERKISQR